MAGVESMNLMSARGVVIPAALMFVIVLWWAGRGSSIAPEVPDTIARSGHCLLSRRSTVTAPPRRELGGVDETLPAKKYSPEDNERKQLSGLRFRQISIPVQGLGTIAGGDRSAEQDLART